MLSVKKMGQGGEDYYLNLTRYYVRDAGKTPPHQVTAMRMNQASAPMISTVCQNFRLSRPASGWAGAAAQLGCSASRFPRN